MESGKNTFEAHKYFLHSSRTQWVQLISQLEINWWILPFPLAAHILLVFALFSCPFQINLFTYKLLTG